MKLFPIRDVGGNWSADLAKDLLNAGVMLAVVGVPWDLIEAHETQCLRNHGQTVEHLATRGGLTASDACAVVENRPAGIPDLSWQAHERLAQLVRDWKGGNNG